MGESVTPAQFSIRGVATYTGYSVSTVRRLIADGLLPTVRVGTKVVRVLKADVDAFLEARRAVSFPKGESANRARLIGPEGAELGVVEVPAAPGVGGRVEGPGGPYRVVEDRGLVQRVEWERELLVEPVV